MIVTLKKFAAGSLFAFGFVSCGPSYPGGLSEPEWNSLSPAKKADLQLRPDQVDAARMAPIEQDLDRAEQSHELDQKMEAKYPPSVRLSPTETAEINELTKKPLKKK